MNNINTNFRYVTRVYSRALCVFAILLVSLQARADTTVSWSLYNDCPTLNSGNEISCGSYGIFYIDSVQPVGCQLVEHGSEIPPRYYPNVNVQDFPAEPVPVESRNRQSRPLGQLKMPNNQAAFNDGSIPPVLISIIDFSGAHGNSVEWMAQDVAGNATTRKFLLDGDESSTLGGVSDLEVLSQLCHVSQKHENYGAGFQTIVNMSFGRALRGDDPVGDIVCQDDRLNCQIRRVIQHLDEKGVVFVGAAGKQRELMFPAAIDEVIAAGMINPAEFEEKGTTRPTWEMPDAPTALDALMPGSSLCIRGTWTAPSGASYSSAILSGWLAQSMMENAPLSMREDGRWVPYLSPDRQCMVLTKNGNEYTKCNDAIDEIFFGLGGGYTNDCWSNGSGATVRTTLKPTPNSQPLTTAAIQWDPLVRPSPEGDPCVPCTGGSIQKAVAGVEELAGSFDINLSQTESLRSDLVIDAVHLRIGSSFHEIELNDDELMQFRDGNVGLLTLEGAADVIKSAASASLFFSLRDVNALDCAEIPDQPPACVWMSTHIHIP